MAKSVRFEVPKEVQGKQLEQEYVKTAQQILKEQTVLRLYREKKISTGTGAKMLGMSLWEFIPFLGQHNLSLFDYSEEEWQEELKNVERERRRLSPKTKRRRK
jgi:predicted HTH domain antitoxin